MTASNDVPTSLESEAKLVGLLRKKYRLGGRGHKPAAEQQLVTTPRQMD
ncbi:MULTISPECIES: hypothetical protein [Pseudomonas]|nr:MULTISPECIES: hypothetical protein [Pseudomonas]UDI91438.1 hypothetical protein I5961_20120 [Pseudomonas sp. IAC-BECa141]UIN54959.1 hypothetical protein LXN51_01030 [Pseudomonas kribbensis]